MYKVGVVVLLAADTGDVVEPAGPSVGGVVVDALTRLVVKAQVEALCKAHVVATEHAMVHVCAV